MLNELQCLQLFMDTRALLEGHFRLTSGRHSKHYVQKDLVIMHTRATAQLCRNFAEYYSDHDIQMVVGPEYGAIVLAHVTASDLTGYAALDDAPPVLATYMVKNLTGGGPRFVFRSAYQDQILGRRILLVEDILTTGGSLKEVADSIKTLGGEIVGAAAIWNRGGVTAEQLGVPELYAAVNKQYPSWLPDDCPLCQEGVAISTNAGKGAADKAA